MQENSEVVQDLRLWLLGLLPREKGESLERRLITDADAFEEISLVEEELIDQYLSGDLSESERTGFESFFMNSPDRQQQFKIAKALRSYVERDRTFRKPASFPATLSSYRIPLVAAASVLVVAVTWLAFRSMPQTGGPALAVVLEPATHTREGGSIQEVNLTRDTQVLELRAKVSKREVTGYRATLLDAEGNTVYNDARPRVDTSGETDVVVIPVPASSISPGQYQLQLEASYPDGRTESAASYRFAIGR